ncbi:hypothetical protein DVR12_11770 [Chitinophaga silvatica]|uniref:EF-hand domain-containing protein n=1 Tax=Chitinophaga silvatica TaxID=2282649 RepID=A0A3E1Y9V7_9BACT|nr:hypothetical protein [Chitinophaga silvatica]RFS22475.1 hypothetical protein DVR12_11770 [Chitinophaga silvatica]
MLDQLMDLVREHAQTSVVNNSAIPNEHNEAVIGAAATSITTGLQQALANGQASDVLALFNGSADTTANPLVSGISNNFMSALLEKLHLDKGMAQQITASLIPTVLGALTKKTNDSSDKSFNLEGILNSLTGGAAQGLNLQGILGSLSGGLDKNGDGKVNLDDLTSLLSNGAKKQGEGGSNNSNEGLGGMLKNLFG